MKLWFDKRLSDPTYYVQIGVRNGKKVTSKNIAKIGKHSELLKQHPDPLAFARSEIKRMNEEKDLKWPTPINQSSLFQCDRNAGFYKTMT